MKPRARHVALDGFGDRGAGRRDPDASARQFALDVGNDLAVGPDDKTHQFGHRPDRAGQRAHALRAGATLVAPAV